LPHDVLKLKIGAPYCVWEKWVRRRCVW